MTNYSELPSEKCYSCRFCVWSEEKQIEVCDIKGCYEGSKYQYYVGGRCGARPIKGKNK